MIIINIILGGVSKKKLFNAKTIIFLKLGSAMGSNTPLVVSI